MIGVFGYFKPSKNERYPKDGPFISHPEQHDTSLYNY